MPFPTVTAAAAPDTVNQQAAEQAAAALLASFVPPAGSTRVTAEPAAATPPMPGPFVNTPGPPDDWPASAERTGWWIVDRSPAALEKKLAAQVLGSLPTSDTTATSDGPDGAGLWTASVETNVTGMSITVEEMDAQLVSYAGGRSVLRVDVVATYRPARTAAEEIAGIGSLTASASTDAGTGETPIPGESVMVTGQAAISQIAALVNALPAATGGLSGGPAAGSGSTSRSGPIDLDLDFHPARRGAADILVQIGPGLGGVQVNVGGVLQPGLDESQLPTSQILQILGVHWNLTSGSPVGQAP